MCETCSSTAGSSVRHRIVLSSTYRHRLSPQPMPLPVALAKPRRTLRSTMASHGHLHVQQVRGRLRVPPLVFLRRCTRYRGPGMSMGGRWRVLSYIISTHVRSWLDCKQVGQSRPPVQHLFKCPIVLLRLFPTTSRHPIASHNSILSCPFRTTRLPVQKTPHHSSTTAIMEVTGAVLLSLVARSSVSGAPRTPLSWMAVV